MGAVQAVGVLDQGNVLSIDPGIGLETVIGACDGENRLGYRHAEGGDCSVSGVNRRGVHKAVDSQEILCPVVCAVPAVVIGGAGVIFAIALAIDQVSGDGLVRVGVGIVLIERGGGYSGVVIRGLLGKTAEIP